MRFISILKILLIKIFSKINNILDPAISATKANTKTVLLMMRFIVTLSKHIVSVNPGL